LSDRHLITSLERLTQVYDVAPAPASLLKELPIINDAYRALIAASPFCVLATSGPDGLDASPRGDGPGFVRVADERTLLLPDRRGNFRLDSLKNILRDPRVGLLFLIPGVGETLRVNGRAMITTNPELLASFAVDDKPLRSVLRITVDTVYFQCARALARSKLWDPGSHVDRKSLPSTGTLTTAARDHKGDATPFDGEAYDAFLAERQKSSLY